MAAFKKKTTLVHHITYMGIMTAINLIFIVLATYVPFLMLLLILLLPFISAVVSYYCQKRYYIIYALASIGLCFIFNISDTIFYVVPAIITGFLIGLMLEKKINPFWLILSSTVVESALTFAFIPLIKLITGVDVVDTFLTIFKLTAFTYKTEVVYLFVFFISLVQCSLTHFILLSDAKKIGIEVNTTVSSFIPYIIGSEITMLLSLVFAFFYTPLAFTFLMMSFYFSMFLFINLVKGIAINNKLPAILLGITLVIGIFVFALCYRDFQKPLGLLLLVIFPYGVTIVSFINYCLLKRDTNI